MLEMCNDPVHVFIAAGIVGIREFTCQCQKVKTKSQITQDLPGQWIIFRIDVSGIKPQVEEN